MLKLFLHKALLITFTAAVYTIAAVGQLPDYQLGVVQEQEGLKTSDVINMAKDNEGFLWLAMQSGVQRFDGRNTLDFPFRESVSRILIDAGGKKWVITRQAVYLFINHHTGFQQVLFEKSGEPILVSLYETNNGVINAIGAAGHFSYHETAKEFKRKDAASLGRLKKANRYFDQFEEALFFGSGDSLFRYQQKTKQTDAFWVGSLYDAIPVSQNELLISTTGFETYRINFLTKEKKLLTAHPQPDPSTNNLVLFDGIELSKGRFLFSGTKGLVEYNTVTGTLSFPVFYNNGRLLENQTSVRSFYKDKKGTVYMTHVDGIFFMNSSGSIIQYFRNYRFGNVQMPDNDVRSFSEDAEGNIWMATINGIVRLNMQTGELKIIEPFNKSASVEVPSNRQVLNDGDYVWVGTSGNGVRLYDKRKNTYQSFVFPATEEGKRQAEAFNRSYIWRIVKLRNNNVLSVGGSRIFLTDATTLATQQLKLYNQTFLSRAAVQDSAGRIWHGTTAGFTCFDTSFKWLFSVKDSLTDRRAASFCEWKKDQMLVGSKGLYEVVVKDNKIISFQKKKAIPAERLIYCMQQDQFGFVWMGTDDGIFRYDPVLDEAVMFDETDHVQSQAFNSDAAFRSKTGMIFMGGKNGVNFFDPSKYIYQPQQLYPLVASFSVNGNDSVFFQTSGLYNIPYNSNNIDFVISAPEFKNPFRIQYRYRLNNGENGWVNTGFNNRIRISKLQPGNYQLQVSAGYDGKTWFDCADALSFVVLKPWWQTWWFRLLCIAGLALLIWGFMHYRKRKKEAAELKRTIEYFTYSGSADSSAELILWDIARNCISRLGFEDCVIYLLDEERNVLLQKAAYGDKNPKAFEIANLIEIPVGKGITGYVAKTGKAELVNDTSKDERYIVDDENRLSELAVPIIHDGKVIGVIDSEHHRKDFFTNHHLHTLQTISSLCAAKIATSVAVEAAKNAENKLLLLNGRMLESKFLNLRLQMNPHFLFNILTSIQYLIVSGQINKATDYLNIFSTFLRSLLNFAEQTVVTLEEELRILRMYVELESLCLDESFIWNVDIDEEIEQEDVLVPFMLLQPFVENAINHGLINKIGEKRFHISIKENDEDSLLCSIEDNGIGREAAQVIKQKNLSSVLHESKAISIVQERLELLQQKTGKKAGFHIEDLFENGQPSGTRVHIIIPYYTKEET
ncbi:sensor histidine kinase [Lacibacter sp.]|uniref:sensor histidine kinase n=1 Tax=Lacibacter sp. TaxID=1915409 RepID=UPI002B4B46E2|nr:histidine kinase [Lacibacter sp.]HLP36016.1 histidine kinase [Lacibacter sp.]